MAILCLANDVEDLKARLDRIIVGSTVWGRKVTAQDLKVSGAMAVLLKDAIMPNLVQTLENTPAIIHGGPFANIAHGCNSVQATRMALKLGDYCVTEAGFGADLGAEKFFDIKCRYAGLVPDCVVLVATIRALKMHGGMALADLKNEDLTALSAGIENLEKHLENMQLFGVAGGRGHQPLPRRHRREVALLRERVSAMGANVVLSDVWAHGGEGGVALAEEVVRLCEGKEKPPFRFVYELGQPSRRRSRPSPPRSTGRTAWTTSMRPMLPSSASRVWATTPCPVCMAKTQSSLSDDKDKLGRPRGWRLTVREVRLSAGAGMIVAVCGKMMTMPGLPKHPAAEKIDLIDGKIVGLF